ncbi:hypothetical protein [Bdellovibrio svalbardensis]|uniref:Uncharacterized protein n=1 Tax=Bdellovibrio svalbardensis TaxID=2972972 RepID=A0ABT6DJ22_9BACT|nr:hypothetical protein [Bdellovibrio svalbardensis]MDG0816854.1 hypothetical protein [Bdellovibrio svalbardensis]
MKIKTVTAGVIVSAGVGIGIYLISAPKTTSSQAPSLESQIATDVVISPTPAAKTAMMKASSDSKASSPREEAAAKKVWEDFKYGRELNKYAAIETKALLLEHDKVAKRKLLHDSGFIHSLQPLLTTVAVHEEAAHLQNVAVDFLFEALKSDLRSDVVQVLQAVVADPSVEDESRDLPSRKSLAGVKAEILFNWSSVEPTSDPEISAALPGPVSQKIWANVKKQQENNLAESATFQSQE